MRLQARTEGEQGRVRLSVPDLPAPPEGRIGWPWTVDETPQAKGGFFADACSGSDRLPKISLVTPSFNQGRFIEETIRSVLLQDYPALEYVIMDGGSTDESVQIIRKYAPFLKFWTSEPDRGQSDAINKGLLRAAGDILGWVNSDDLLMPGALWAVAACWRERPDAVAWVGACREIDVEGAELRIRWPRLRDKAEAMAGWGADVSFYQPSCFFSAAAFEETGGLNRDLHYVMDVDLWMRLARRGPFEMCNSVLSSARLYPEAKTFSNYWGRQAEFVAAAVNNGFAEGAARRLAHIAATGRANPYAPSEFARVVDRVPFKEIVWYLARRVVRRTTRVRGQGSAGKPESQA